MKFFSRTALMLFGGVILLLTQSLLAPVASASLLSSNTKSTQSITRSSCLQPSHHSNLMALSNSALMALGLPSQQVIHQNPAHWSYIFSHLGRRICEQGHTLSLPKNIEEHHGISPYAIGDGCNANPGSKCESDVWAGNLAIGKGRGAYVSADLTVVVPVISKTPNTSEVAYWAGVGGDGSVTNSVVVVQAGIISGVSGNSQFNESIVDVANNVPYANLPLCRLAAGDKIEMYTESNLNGDGYDYFLMDNASDGYCYNSCTVQTNSTSVANSCNFGDIGNGTSGSSFNSDSASGECIVERINGGIGNPLAQFNPSSNVVQMQNCLVNNTKIGAQAHNYKVLENDSGQLLAGPGAIESDQSSFPVVWHRSS